MDKKKLIDGTFVGASDGAVMENINPYNGELIGTVPKATKEDVDRAVASAKEGAKIWGAMRNDEREGIINKFLTLYDDHKEEIAAIDVEEGEVISIIGPSGSGKSTLLRCVNQLETQSGGKIFYCGKNILNSELKLQDMNIPVNTLSDLEESYPNHPFFNMIFPLGFQTSDTQEKIYELQTKNINEYVDRESCIIVGRCSDFILRDHPNSIKIFIYAPYEERLKNCVESLNMKEDEAKKMIDEVDKARSNYHRHFAGTEPGDRKYIDVAIDSSLLGVDETANALTDLVKRKFCKS